MKSKIMVHYIRFIAAALCIHYFVCSSYAQTSGRSLNRPFAATQDMRNVDVSTDVMMCALPAATLVGVCVLQDWEGLKQGVFTALGTAGTTLILKYAISERRPDGSNYHSFPSGHSATTYATAAFIQRRYGWALGAPAYALATYTAWGRVFARKHHVWDVVTGAAIGAASAYIFTTPFAKRHNLTLAPVSDGLSVGIAGSLTL